MAKDISIQLPDGSFTSLPSGSSAFDLAKSIGAGLLKSALAAKINKEPADLDHPLKDGDEVEIITGDSDEGLEIIRHSTAHILAQAVLSLYPGSTYAIGPPIENGFYYDFQLPESTKISEEDLESIEKKMHEIIKADQPFQRFSASPKEALKLFSSHPYKCEIIQAVSDAEGAKNNDLLSEIDKSEAVSYYKNSEEFIDLCKGPHVPSTGRLGNFALEKTAGAYWRGNEKGPVLQRIYGTAWNRAKELKEYLVRLQEAQKRDHRRLAKELDLLSWHEELGPGLAIWHPKGSIVREIIEDYSKKRHISAGYDQVFSPHIAKSRLWETSGHLDFYSESMYPPMELDGSQYYPKPMNCPFHTLAFSSSQKSYRQLPIRLFELGTVYRYELSGVVHGLMRGRGFTQDDSHIFCTNAQMPAELFSLLDFSLSVLRDFGFREFQIKLSTRPLEKSVGEDSLWELATRGLEDSLKEAKQDFKIDEGGGAFYGPKIDIDVKDAIGRSWQLSTIQVDFNLPERFNLTYTAEDGKKHRPVMIHRALMGSIERFFGVLLEHYAGALPLWLAPEQVKILPVSKDHTDYAQKVVNKIKAAGFRAAMNSADEPLAKRIRTAKLEKLPYILVAGDEDISSETVGVNPRSDYQTKGSENTAERGVKLESFIERLKDQLEKKI